MTSLAGISVTLSEFPALSFARVISSISTIFSINPYLHALSGRKIK
jgi:hypothetical protein